MYLGVLFNQWLNHLFYDEAESKIGKWVIKVIGFYFAISIGWSVNSGVKDVVHSFLPQAKPAEQKVFPKVPKQWTDDWNRT